MLIRACLLSLFIGLGVAAPGLGQFKANDADGAGGATVKSGSPDSPTKPVPDDSSDGAARSGRAAPNPRETLTAPDREGMVECERGMVIKAVGGSFRNVVGTTAIPGDVPGEQRVRVVAEEVPPGATVRYKTLEGATRQVTFALPSLAAGQKVRVAVTFEVELLPSPPVPPDALRFKAPGSGNLDRKLASYLAPSPLIESNRAEVSNLAQEVAGDKSTSWEKARAINAWVYENIKFEMPAQLGRQSVLETIEKHTGVCAEKNSLAVALLRASHIPARLVRVASTTSYEHCYYEFYLTGVEGAKAWFAGDASASFSLDPRIGSRGRIILQKGDSLVVQDPKTNKKVKQRFLETSLAGFPNTPGARLELEVIGR